MGEKEESSGTRRKTETRMPSIPGPLASGADLVETDPVLVSERSGEQLLLVYRSLPPAHWILAPAFSFSAPKDWHMYCVGEQQARAVQLPLSAGSKRPGWHGFAGETE